MGGCSGCVWVPTNWLARLARHLVRMSGSVPPESEERAERREGKKEMREGGRWGRGEGEKEGRGERKKKGREEGGRRRESRKGKKIGGERETGQDLRRV